MNKKLAQIEGLRGIAAFVVLLNHIRFTFFIDITDRIESKYGKVIATIAEALFDGNFSVWLFWIMSAFVLSIRFYTEKDRVLSHSIVTDAAIRRYPRLLLPVTVSVLFAWILHSFGFMTNIELSNFFGDQYKQWLGSFYLFKPNLLSALDSCIWETFFSYNPYTSYNRVLWTMKIELYGSFFLFSLLLLIGKHSSRLFFYLIITTVLYKLSAHWLNSFVIGMMICDSYVHQHLIRQRLPTYINKVLSYLINSNFFAILMIFFLLYMVGLPNINGVLHLFLAAILTGYVTVSSPVKALLSVKPLVFLGKISFGLYLVHLPLICATAFPLYTSLIKIFVSPLVTVCFSSFLLVIFSIVAGWCLWFIADRPSIIFSRRISDKFRTDRP